MKLNDSFLAVQWEHDRFLKMFYQREHTASNKIPIGLSPLEATAWMAGRHEVVEEIIDSNGIKIYYLTSTMQEQAALIKYRAANMRWLRQIKDQRSLYITNKNEFFRFTKEGDYIMCLQYTRTGQGIGEMVNYEGFALNLEDEELKMLPTQDQEIGHRFIKLLMFIELSKLETVKVKPGAKVKYGSGHDDKLLNDTSFKNIYIVDTNWNKIIIVQGGFKVRGHFRIQPCGAGRKDFRLTWISEYTKGSFVRRAGKQIRDNDEIQ